MASSPVPDAAILTDLQADTFQKAFYDTLDYRREAIGKFYQDESVVVWNGTRIKSQAPIDNFYRCMPISRHDVTSYDIQPIDAGAGTMADSRDLLVTVAGTVCFGKETTGTFHETFILRRDRRQPNRNHAYFIVLDTYRFNKTVV